MNSFTKHRRTLAKVLGLLTVAVFVFSSLEPRAFAAASLNVSTADALQNAIRDINAGIHGENGEFTLIVSGSITLKEDLEELIVPTGLKLTIKGENIAKIDGDNQFRGLVITNTSNPTLQIENIQFNRCVAQGESGEDGQVAGGGGGAGLGGAIYVKSGDVSIAGVQFTNNKAVGGSGGGINANAAAEYGDGGELNGGNAGNTSGAQDGEFGGGGGGSPNRSNAGSGGLGGGDGAADTISNPAVGYGGGGLGAGGAVYVEKGANLIVKYTDSGTDTAFGSSNSAVAGNAGGTGASKGDAVGNAIFAGGKITFDTSDISGSRTFSEDIGGLGAISNLDLENSSELLNHSGGVVVQGGGTLVLSGKNSYSGKTEILNGTLIADKGNAIGDYSEVEISDSGILELKANETIGYLSSAFGASAGELHLYYTDDSGNKRGGYTLEITGDKRDSSLNSNINPFTGSSITSYLGKILTDGDAATKERIVKSGTATLILGADNSNENDEFTVEIREGTIQLDHEKALGGGKVEIRKTDAEESGKTLQIGAKAFDSSSEDYVEIANDIQIYDSGVLRVGMESGFTDSSQVDFSGKITGSGSRLAIQMNNRDQVFKLSNVENSYGITVLERGILAVAGEQDEISGTWKTALGTGKVIFSAGDSVFRADSNGMVITNPFEIAGSTLKLTNVDSVEDFSFTLKGALSGSGQLEIDLGKNSDQVVLSGASLLHTGATNINQGILKFEGYANHSAVLKGGLSASSGGTLDLNGTTITFGDASSTVFEGKIIDSDGTDQGGLIKNGSGTWTLNLQSGSSVNTLGIQKGKVVLGETDEIYRLEFLSTDTTLELSGDVAIGSLLDYAYGRSDGSTLNIGDHVLTIRSAERANSYYAPEFGGTLIGDGTIVVERDGDFTKSQVDLYLGGNSSESWGGTIWVEENASLYVDGYGAFGNFDPEKGNVGSVQLQGGKLSAVSNGFNNQLAKLEITTGTEGEVFTAGSFEYSGYEYNRRLNLVVHDLLGSGDLLKTGVGSLALIGKNDDFSGNIVLRSGSLHLGEEASLGSGSLRVEGDEENGDERVLVVYSEGDSREIDNDMEVESSFHIFNNRIPELELSGKLSGNGSVNLNGAGTTVLSGNYQDYTGEFVFQGAGIHAKLQSDLNHSSVLVQYGGSLETSTRFIKSLTLGNEGMLKIDSSTGVLSMNSFTMKQGSVLQVDCNGIDSGSISVGGGSFKDGDGNMLESHGQVVLNGGIVHINVLDGESITLGDQFTLIVLEDENVEFLNSRNLIFTDNLQGLRVVGSYNAEDRVYEYKFVSFDYLEGAKSSNEFSVAQYMNHMVDNTAIPEEMNSVLNILESYIGEDPARASAVYNELSGEIYGSMGIAQMQALSLVNQTLAAQLRPGAMQKTWDGTGSSDYGYCGQTYADRGLSGWITAYGMLGDVDPDGNASGYDLEVYGTLFALERCSSDLSRRLGLYYGFGGTTVDTNSALGKGTSDDHRLGLYMKWDDRFGYGLMSGSVGFNSFKFNRRLSVAGTDFQSKPDGMQAGFYAERGKSFQFGNNNAIQPFLALQYAYQHQDGFTEGGANGFRLHGDGIYTNSLRTMLGARFVKDVIRNRGILQLSAQGHWLHEYLDDDGVLDARFAGIQSGTTFAVYGNNPGRDWAVLGGGVQWSPFAHSGLHVSGNYDAQINDKSLLHTGSVGLKIVW